MLLEYTGKSPSVPPKSPASLPLASALRERDWVYLPDPGLVQAVNIALLLEQPLLVTGEPGTGKTQLAYSVASELNLGDVLRFDTKSSSTYRDLFYHFDSLRSFRDAQNQVKDRTSLNYIDYSALGQAILLANDEAAVGKHIRGFVHSGAPRRSLVLIDEVDKAPRDFPNDILREIEQMYFDVPELEAHFSPRSSSVSTMSEAATSSLASFAAFGKSRNRFTKSYIKLTITSPGLWRRIGRMLSIANPVQPFGSMKKNANAEPISARIR